MITKVCIAVMLLNIAIAKELVENSPEELKVQSPQVKEFTTGEWVAFALGACMGVLIELGTNTASFWPCLGQPSDVAEAVYFTYFYIR